MKKNYTYYSIIVPSHNRQQEIQELLESFVNLKPAGKSLELIIADDGSTDETVKVVEQFQDRLPFDLHFYRQERQGPGAARNLGMSRAKGDFFIFIDSDCTVHPEWLIEIDRALHENSADAFGGPDSFRPDFPSLLKAIDYSMTSFITTGGLRGRKGKKLAKYYPRSFNMGLSRQLYEKIGGFGNLRHGQDIEYSNRIIRSGAKVVYAGEAVVYHKRRTGIRKFFRQVFNWGVARINLYRLNNSMLEPLHTAPALATSVLFLLILISLLSAQVWTYSRWIFFAGALILIFSGIHAAFKYKDLKAGFLVPLVMPIQVIGYGLGFISAFTWRVLLRKSEFVGFKKRYYK